MDPFATLGIPATFDVDLAAVEKVHRELSRALHPDKHAAGTAGERREALARAVEVNEAWRIVRYPLRRAEALVARASAGGAPAREAAADPQLLGEVLERREALAEVRAARDKGELVRLRDEARAQVHGVERALARELTRQPSNVPSDALAALLVQLRYHRRFLEEVSALEEEFD